MGTQGNGSRVSAIRGGVATWGLRQNAFAKLSTVLSLLMIVIALWTSTVRAQTTNYVYDADGRVVAVTQNNGTTAQYTYDTLGHLAQTTTVTSGQLTIFAFTPTHGESGAQVTIEGQGFSASPASDSVSFNGTPATVLSASTTEIVTMVPSGAATGPISVTVNGQTATSATSFVIDDSGEPPTITQITPSVVNAGGVVTITGTHLDPVPGGTIVQSANLYTIAPASINDTQLQFVPTSSGPVTVETPYGEANGPSSITVLPSSVSSSNVTSVSAIAVGASTSLSMVSTSQISVVTFQGVTGQWPSLQGSAFNTTGGVNYTVYAPDNVQIASGVISSSSPSIHLPNLYANGTYLVTFTPSVANTQFTVGLQSDPILTSNTLATLPANGPGQSQRVVFMATAGQNLEFTLNAVSIAGSTSGVSPSIYGPNDTYVGGNTWVCYNTYTCRYAIWNVTEGAYTLTLSPPSTTSTVGFQVLVSPDIQGPQLSSGTLASISLGLGQVERYTFNANEGGNVTLMLSDVNTGNTQWPLTVNVYSPSTGTITTSNYYATFNAPGVNGYNTINLSDLPATGTYTAVVYDTGMVATGQLTMAASNANSIAENGVSQNDADSVNGQNVYLSFTANQGDNVALTLSGLSITGATTSPVSVNVYNASGTNISAANNCYQSSSGSVCQYSLFDLPAGTYTVIVSPPNDSSTIDFNATLEPIASVASSIPTTGAIQTVSDSARGQNIYLTFMATQGDNQELTLTNLAITGTTSGNVAVNVYAPNGANVGSFDSCENTFTCRYALWNLTAGTYTVVVSPPDSKSTISTQVMVQPDIQAGALTAGIAANVNLAEGQVARYTFTGTQGSNVALSLSNATTGNVNWPLIVYVYSPTTGTITTTNYYTTFSTPGNGGSDTINLSNLPATGTYTVVVFDTGMPATAQIAMAPDVTDSIAENDVSQSDTDSINGQNVYLSFVANQGDNVVLTLSGLSITGATTSPVSVNVYNASGANVSAANNCYQNSLGGVCQYSLFNLAAGTYTVTVSPPNDSSTIDFNATLEPIASVASSIPTTGAIQTVSDSARGQNIYLTFMANQGDNQELTLTNLAITGTTSGNVAVNVYGPNGANIGSFDSCENTFTCRYALWNLMAGTCTVVISPPDSKSTISTQVMVQPDVQAGALTAGTPANVNLAEGQVARYTFTGTQGGNVALSLSDATTGNVNWPLIVDVYSPATGTITTTNYYTTFRAPGNGGSGTINLSNLPATGTYTVAVFDTGMPATAQLLLTSN